MPSSTILDRDIASGTTRPGVRLGARRSALIVAALAVFAAGAVYGRDWWVDGRFMQSTDDAYVGGNVTSIAPHVGGFIQAVLVTDHQLVRAGQVVVRLDPRDMQAALDHAEAVVAARTAALDSLRAQMLLQRSTIEQQAADLAVKTAQSDYATADAERYRSLAITSAGSRQDAQRTASLQQQARNAVLSAEAAWQAARQRVPVLEAQTAEATAELAQAQADRQAARLNLEYTDIRSPIDGYVGNRAAQVGAYVAQAGYLLSVIPADGLWVDANFKEDQLADLAPGRSASVVADVLPSHAFRGHVVSLSPGTGAVFSVIPPENATGNFTKIVQRVPVRVALDPGDARLTLLRPGLSTTVRVDTRAVPCSPQ